MCRGGPGHYQEPWRSWTVLDLLDSIVLSVPRAPTVSTLIACVTPPRQPSPADPVPQSLRWDGDKSRGKSHSGLAQTYTYTEWEIAL
ncbi:hypothetical protein V496_09593 [Pseudogymnoascus sp. VKM F-4515 (FW-2607)]|nr:hypothetical protein V496_09593 [Pseudogymnoascus sp. VKM F-4515 (FW-2607)]